MSGYSRSTAARVARAVGTSTARDDRGGRLGGLAAGVARAVGTGTGATTDGASGHDDGGDAGGHGDNGDLGSSSGASATTDGSSTGGNSAGGSTRGSSTGGNNTSTSTTSRGAAGSGGGGGSLRDSAGDTNGGDTLSTASGGSSDGLGGGGGVQGTGAVGDGGSAGDDGHVLSGVDSLDILGDGSNKAGEESDGGSRETHLELLWLVKNKTVKVDKFDFYVWVVLICETQGELRLDKESVASWGFALEFDLKEWLTEVNGMLQAGKEVWS